MKYILKKSGELIPAKPCVEQFLVLAIFDVNTPEEICKMFNEARVLIQQEINDHAINHEKAQFKIEWEYLNGTGVHAILEQYYQNTYDHSFVLEDDLKESFFERLEETIKKEFPVEVFS